MRLSINQLRFVLSDNPVGESSTKLDKLTRHLKSFGESAGTSNVAYKTAYEELRIQIIEDGSLSSCINSALKVRALGMLFQSDIGESINLDDDVFIQIDKLKPDPSTLFIQNLYQFYLNWYDKLSHPRVVSEWLLLAMGKRKLLKNYHQHVLSTTGPKWIAAQCIDHNRSFDNEIAYLDLDDYASGRFLTVANSIYFVEQLKEIPVNRPNQLLTEVQCSVTYESRYDQHLLLGHRILEILIGRAPDSGVDDSWLNTILAIAGDPRVSKGHPNYLKWWSAIDESLNLKVRGWLSRLDLRLFLEALENFSRKPGNVELKRMYPARKRFLEGLLENKLITGTRLYLVPSFISYLEKNYAQEHLPNYSTVSTGDKSVIHIQLGKAHMIEGSHSCKLWIYRSLNSNAIVLDYGIDSTTYASLTQDMAVSMYDENDNHLLIDSITHHPPLAWQNKAIKALNKAKVKVFAKDVLTGDDFKEYKREYGAR